MSQRKRHSKDLLDQAERLYLRGADLASISQKLDIPQRTLRHHRRRGNWEGTRDMVFDTLARNESPEVLQLERLKTLCARLSGELDRKLRDKAARGILSDRQIDDLTRRALKIGRLLKQIVTLRDAISGNASGALNYSKTVP